MTQETAAWLTVPVNEKDHLRGPKTAAVTMVEYGDFECPHCARVHPVVQQLQQLVPIRFVYRHFPLTTVHPHAARAAEASEAAGAQGAFWEMHDMLFESQDALEDEDLVQFAGALGLELSRFAEDLATRKYAPRVREHFLSGARSGVNGTPTFFINGARHDGACDLETLLSAIQMSAESPRDA